MPTPPTFLLRAATPADIPAIHAMILELANFEHLAHQVVATETMLHAGLFGPQPGGEALVGVDNGEVVSFALYFHNFSTFLGRKGLYLEDLYVKPSHRGKGYGRQSLVHLAQLALERGCGRFEWSVLDWNAAAIGFYQGMGAEVLPDWRVCRVTGEALRHLAAS